MASSKPQKTPQGAHVRLAKADTADLFRIVRNLREPGWAREVALKRIEEQYGTVRDALIDHLQTHNGAPGNPEPLCACESCKLGRAALSNPARSHDA